MAVLFISQFSSIQVEVTLVLQDDVLAVEVGFEYTIVAFNLSLERGLVEGVQE